MQREVQPGTVLSACAVPCRASSGSTSDGATATTVTGTTDHTETLSTTGITAVALNLTATNSSAGEFVTAHPDGIAEPSSSNVNFSEDETVDNAAIVPVGADGKIDFAVTGPSGITTDLVADVQGYYIAGNTGASVFVPVTPTAVVDTRSDLGADGPIQPGVYVSMPGQTGVTAYAFNTTVTDGTEDGFLSVYPYGSGDNVISSLNFSAGEMIANNTQVTTPVINPAGSFDIMNNSTGTVQIVVDEFGFSTTQ